MKRKVAKRLTGAIEARENINIYGKNLYMRLLSVYDALICESKSRKLLEKLVEDGADKKIAQSIAENAVLAAMCLYDRKNKLIFSSGLDAITSLTSEELLKIAEEYVNFRDRFLNFNNLNPDTLEEVKKN